MDQLVIAGRTRYPSDCPEHGGLSTLDKQIAKTLLSLDGQSHSRQVSTQSSAPSNASFQRDTTGFVEKYNELAQRHGLNKLNVLSDHCSDKRDAHLITPKPATASKRGIWRKLVRSSSSHHLPDSRHLVHKNSLNTLLGKQPKLALNCQSLDDFYQYGGTSILNLPAPYRAFRLRIPTCLAASGNYLLQYGQSTGGIFRIPGQNSIVQALYHYYVARMHEAQNAHELVHESIGSVALPVDIPCGVQDVASVFKKFLWDLPGGILGSIGLFQALRNVQSKQDCANFRPQLCALAILSIMSTRRIAIISAVLGLLAFLKQDSDGSHGSSSTPNRALTSESMSSKAVSLVFAPILLGNLIDQITVAGSGQSDFATAQHINVETPRRGFKNAFRTPKHRKSSSIDHMPEIQASVERNNMAVDILEMLLRSWEDIASNMRMLDSRSVFERSSKSFNNLVGLLPPLQQGSIFDGQASSATSTRSGHLQVPQLSHSISLQNMPQVEASSASDDDAKATCEAKQGPELQNPLLHVANSDYGAIRNVVHNHENTPWWTRKLNRSFRSSVKPSGIYPEFVRVTSDSTMLFPNPSYDQDDDKFVNLNLNDGTSNSVQATALPVKVTTPERVDVVVDSKQETENTASSVKQAADEDTCYGSIPCRTSNKSSEGPVDSGIEVSGRGSEASGSEAGSLENSMPAYLLAMPPSSRVGHVPRKSSILEVHNEDKTYTPPESSRNHSGEPPILTIERMRSVRKIAEGIDKGAARKPLHVSPSLIPRPVCNSGRHQSAGTGSPSSRVSASVDRRPLSRIPRTSTIRTRGSKIESTDRLLPMYPRPFLGENDVREVMVRSEPVKRSINHSSSQTSGLRGEPVARQLEFERAPVNHPKGYRMADSLTPLVRQQALGYRGSTNVGTLYAEIRVLNDKLNGARRECVEWRNRAQWAESVLFGQGRQGQQQESYQY